MAYIWQKDSLDACWRIYENHTTLRLLCGPSRSQKKDLSMRFRFSGFVAVDDRFKIRCQFYYIQNSRSIFTCRAQSNGNSLLFQFVQKSSHSGKHLRRCMSWMNSSNHSSLRTHRSCFSSSLFCWAPISKMSSKACG